MTWIKTNKLVFTLLLFCIGFGVYYVMEVRQWLFYPNQIDYGEGYIQYINYMFANGTWHWGMDTPPYIPLMYGIVTPLIDAPLIKTFGNEIWTTRLLMVIAVVVSSFMVWLIVRQITKNRIWAWIGALIPFTQPIIRDWSLMARVDTLACMFDLVGLALFVRFKDSKHIYWSIIPFTIAIFTKPTFIAAMIAVLIYLAVNNSKQFMRYIAILLPVVGVCFGILQYISGGEYINHVYTVSKTVDFIWAFAVIQNNWAGILTPLVALLALTLLYIKKSFGKGYIKFKELDIFGIFFVVAFVMDFGSGLRPGGFLNYYLEFIYATCICAVLVLPKFISKAKEVYAEHGAIGGYAIIYALLIIMMLAVSTKTAFPFPDETYDEDVRNVTQIIQDTKQPVITENTGLVINAGKDLYAEFFIMTNLAHLRIWDDTNYVNDYKKQKFDYIIMRTPLYNRPDGDGHFSKEIMDIIKENYTLIYDPPENFYWYGLSCYESNKKLATDTRFDGIVLPMGHEDDVD